MNKKANLFFVLMVFMLCVFRVFSDGHRIAKSLPDYYQSTLSAHLQIVLPPREVLTWAFGPEYGTMPIHKIDDVWNSRHSDIFLMHGSDEINSALKRVTEAYEKKRK